MKFNRVMLSAGMLALLAGASLMLSGMGALDPTLADLTAGTALGLYSLSVLHQSLLPEGTHAHPSVRKARRR